MAPRRGLAGRVAPASDPGPKDRVLNTIRAFGRLRPAERKALLTEKGARERMRQENITVRQSIAHLPPKPLHGKLTSRLRDEVNCSITQAGTPYNLGVSLCCRGYNGLKGDARLGDWHQHPVVPCRCAVAGISRRLWRHRRCCQRPPPQRHRGLWRHRRYCQRSPPQRRHRLWCHWRQCAPPQRRCCRRCCGRCRSPPQHGGWCRLGQRSAPQHGHDAQEGCSGCCC